jgi:hypothetical protein
MFDIIGDIHGHADGLLELLGRLSYRPTAGAYRHPDRRAPFSATSSTEARKSATSSPSCAP